MPSRAVSPAPHGTATPAVDYETLRTRHLGDMRARIPAALERLNWPIERLQAQREAALRDLVRIVKERS